MCRKREKRAPFRTEPWPGNSFRSSWARKPSEFHQRTKGKNRENPGAETLKEMKKKTRIYLVLKSTIIISAWWMTLLIFVSFPSVFLWKMYFFVVTCIETPKFIILLKNTMDFFVQNNIRSIFWSFYSYFFKKKNYVISHLNIMSFFRFSDFFRVGLRPC